MKEQFIMLPYSLLGDVLLDSENKLIIALVESFQRDKKTFHISDARIAKMLNVKNRQTVNNRIKALVEMGYLTKQTVTVNNKSKRTLMSTYKRTTDVSARADIKLSRNKKVSAQNDIVCQQEMTIMSAESDTIISIIKSDYKNTSTILGKSASEMQKENRAKNLKVN
jgi:DNA-binding Lrp family transcriptional regulator